MIEVIVIPIEMDQALKLEKVDNQDLPAYRRLVGGGPIELVSMERPDAGMYINENGKLDGLPLNVRATWLAAVHNDAFRNVDVIAGPAFIVGPADRQANDLGAPRELVDLLFKTSRYKVEVRAFEEARWVSNDITYRTWETAYLTGLRLAARWTNIESLRVVPDK